MPKGRVLARDPGHDLAVVELEKVPDGVQALPLAKDQSSVGDPVFSIGNPGAANGFFIYTHGEIRQFLRNQEMQIQVGEGAFLLHSDIILTSSPTNPGDSGGPLVNHRAEMIGVTQSLVSEARAVSNFIDIGEVRKFLDIFARQTGTQLALVPGPGLTGTADDLTALRDILKGSDRRARLDAVNKLAERGPEAKLAVGDLLRCLKNGDPTLQSFVRNALKKIGAPSESEASAIMELLNDSSQTVRLAAIQELALMGENARTALPGLMKCLDDRNSRIRRDAADAIARIGVDTADRDALFPALTKVLKDSDPSTILDIKARDQAGRQFNVEMQMLVFPYYEKRILYYWGRLHQQQLHEGQHYLLLQPTISISFLDHVLLPQSASYHTRFQLLETVEQFPLTADLEFHLLELPKFTKWVAELVSELDVWLYFLRHAEKIDVEALPQTLDRPLFTSCL